jgi:hypothetical protein
MTSSISIWEIVTTLPRRYNSCSQLYVLRMFKKNSANLHFRIFIPDKTLDVFMHFLRSNTISKTVLLFEI